MTSESRQGRVDGPTLNCRCWGCGSSDPQSCGVLCIDCSWEEHLAAYARTGEFDKPREDTPECCLSSRHSQEDE